MYSWKGDFIGLKRANRMYSKRFLQFCWQKKGRKKVFEAKNISTFVPHRVHNGRKRHIYYQRNYSRLWLRVQWKNGGPMTWSARSIQSSPSQNEYFPACYIWFEEFNGIRGKQKKSRRSSVYLSFFAWLVSLGLFADRVNETTLFCLYGIPLNLRVRELSSQSNMPGSNHFVKGNSG